MFFPIHSTDLVTRERGCVCIKAWWECRAAWWKGEDGESREGGRVEKGMGRVRRAADWLWREMFGWEAVEVDEEV